MLHDAAEGLAGEGVDHGFDFHRLFELAHVCFVHVGQNPHFSQVLRDHEEHRRLERRDHRGARVDGARDHDAVDRRVDLGEALVRGSLGELRLNGQGLRRGGRHLGLCDFVLATRSIELASRGQVLFEEFFDAVEVCFGCGQIGLRALALGTLCGEVRGGLAHLGVEHGGIDFGEQIAFLDHRVEVDGHLRDTPIGLRADVHLEKRLHCARGLDLLAHVPAADRGEEEPGRGRWLVLRANDDATRDERQEAKNDGKAPEPYASAFFRREGAAQLVGGRGGRSRLRRHGRDLPFEETSDGGLVGGVHTGGHERATSAEEVSNVGRGILTLPHEDDRGWEGESNLRAGLTNF